MGNKLEGKVAVVTGGGGDIGKGIALGLASEGAKVVVNDISQKDGTYAADKVVEQIRKAKGAAVASYDSVATMAGGENIVKSAISNFGRVDILVNTAGNHIQVPFLEMTEQQWDSIMNVHLKGHFSCSKAAALHMARQKSGRIINFSSRGAFFGHGAGGAYGAAKAGILGLTVRLAAELKEYNITVNAIIPSAITQLFPADRRPQGDNMPPHEDKRPQPEFVAPIVVYLATDQAQGITGRFFYAAAGDICIYAHPFRLSTANAFVRKTGKWTVDELSEIVPPILGIG